MQKAQPPFSDSELSKICAILGETNRGLTGSEIARLLAVSKIVDTDPTLTKQRRIFNALANHQNTRQSGTGVMNFIYHALSPPRYTDNPDLFDSRCQEINKVLSFRGLEFRGDGNFYVVAKAETLRDAVRRAQSLQSKLQARATHPDLLTFCKPELLTDNYFHAVLEASKSVANKIRTLTGEAEDGASLVNKVFMGSTPLI